MISTVKLYKDSKIIEGRNFVVDDIGDYLATLSDTITITGFQYVKHGVSISIKINKSQTYLDYKATNDYNYCSIQNSNSDGTGTEKTVYYFIDKMSWLAQTTLKLDLIMDTVNTFTMGTDYTISSKTTIKREHKDRWKEIPGSTSSKTYTASTYCRGESMLGYYGQVTIPTGATSITINSATSNASVSTAAVASTGNIVVTVIHDNPMDRINIVVNATVISPKTYQRIIDPVSEGINSILFQKTNEDITDNNNLSWYLIYKNKDNISTSDYNVVNPIEVQLRASEAISVKEYTDFTINAADLNNGDYILITPVFNNLPATSINQSSKNIYSITSNGYLSTVRVSRLYIKKEAYADSTDAKSVVIYKTGGNMYVAQVIFTDAGVGYMNASGLTGFRIVDTVKINANGLTGGTIKYYKATFSIISDMYEYQDNSNQTATLTLSAATVIDGIDMLDRTDSKLIKVIKCPYCPSKITTSNQYFILGRGWTLATDNGLDVISLTDINIDLVNNVESNITSPIKELYNKSLTINTSAARDDSHESKLFHSDYYQNKIVYDSFSYMVQLENLDPTNSIFGKTVPDLFQVDWMTTNTINSRFLARFPQLKYNKAIQDFNDILYINRNNELPVFNSTYLNYLRTGYNYDVKQKNAMEEKAQGDLILSIISNMSKIGIGAMGGAVTGGGPAGIAIGATSGLISGTVSIVQQSRNAAYNIARQEDAIAEKLATAKATAVSVSAADDVNLLDQYCPVPKCINYTVGDNFKKAIADLFYYCGYRRDLQGSPDTTTRYWFNFLQADLVIATTNNIPSDIMADIVSKYAEGITRLHHHTTWDFNQEKENWEVSII